VEAVRGRPSNSITAATAAERMQQSAATGGLASSLCQYLQQSAAATGSANSLCQHMHRFSSAHSSGPWAFRQPCANCSSLLLLLLRTQVGSPAEGIAGGGGAHHEECEWQHCSTLRCLSLCLTRDPAAATAAAARPWLTCSVSLLSACLAAQALLTQAPGQGCCLHPRCACGT
jgi:hypothetical protein